MTTASYRAGRSDANTADRVRIDTAGAGRVRRPQRDRVEGKNREKPPAAVTPGPVPGISPVGSDPAPANEEVPMEVGSRARARCGGEIPAERVEALPDTMVCVGCAREMGGEFRVYVVPERTSKAGSLKHNVGGYTTRKVRKPIRPPE